MAEANTTGTPDASVYRVDAVRGEQASVYHVLRCEVVARFDNPEHAAFLTELLTKGQTHD